VGVDLRTEINAKDYQVPFAFNGTINNLVVKLGKSQLSVAGERRQNEALARAHD
jgi:hypothetical protein